jgi:hypothetical protein
LLSLEEEVVLFEPNNDLAPRRLFRFSCLDFELETGSAGIIVEEEVETEGKEEAGEETEAETEG